jgi:hypothetical protein
MPRFDAQNPHKPHANDPLVSALYDVEVPKGLESRLLDCIAFSDSANKSAVVTVPSEVSAGDDQRWSRRKWLATGLAVGFGGVIAGGRYFWPRRKIAQQEAINAVLSSLDKDDWVVPWKALPSTGPAAKLSVPASLRTPRGWQMRDTLRRRDSVAYDMSLPGCPAVLFAIKTRRELSSFPAAPPKPRAQTGAWNFVAVWRGAKPGHLYVLAFQGPERDYERLFRRGRAVKLA